MAMRSFDTYASKEDSESLVLFINLVSDGRILCFAAKDDASMSLKKTTRNLFKILGSENFERLGWRDNFAFVVQKKGKVYAESLGKAETLGTWAAPVSIDVNVPLASGKNIECRWEETEVNKRRRVFCNKYEGYGSVCSCTNPAEIDIKSDPLPGNALLELPVAIIASNRPHYLYRMIRSMLSASGADPKMVTVFIDGYFEEPLAVAKLFGLRGIQHTPISSKNARISQHYKASLTTTFNLYPKAEYMIIIEEDLDVSPDLFYYFQQLLPVMNDDGSVYCISAWNDQGYDHTVGDNTMLYRVETMPGLGWVLKRKMYKDELEPKWPTPDKFWDWDMWMRLPEIRKGRECIIPDISRTYHFGTKGLNMHPLFQELYFKKHALNTEPNVKLNTEVIKKDNYEKEIERLIGTAVVLDHNKNPCNHSDFIPDTQRQTYVFYMRMVNAVDWVTWKSISKCLHIWDLDVRGFHKSMWRLWLKGNHILIVGTPASPYSKHKPSNIQPIYIPKKGS
ncbi:predicted protein [Nematostella vectensis]|uniref:Alpha-1,3-mannosyl-glycoprotein 2-beta-N-acetylglucosaminyltransferase n=2 Tax=Nematostella vectensis TaxID=45351 RepID=A7RRM3_NEMVE|nr:predicted protein [Nematostella vectensis]|eukprot:XP_001637848.1 predicted protein [Nematostella vectensis]